MPKITYNNITFDSELEVNYYKYLQDQLDKGNVLQFIYHPRPIPAIVGKRSYTPDFIVKYSDRHIEVVETKGYNPYSKMIDDAIHQAMLCKSEAWLADYIYSNFVEVKGYTCSYKKIKHLKAYGFVDWDFKNPNTIANKRKEKINEQQDEIKELKDFKKDAERYFRYHLKIVDNKKLTKPQREWYYKYVEFLRLNYKED